MGFVSPFGYQGNGVGRSGQVMPGFAAGAAMGGQGISGMNPILAAALSSGGPMNWQGAGDFAQRSAFANMNPSTSLMMQGQQGFGGQMQGAMGQMGGLMQNNANVMQNQQQQAMQAQLMREGRHDSNQKFSMVFDALLKPTQRQEYRDLNNNIQYRQVSPLLQAFKDMMGGGGSQSFGSSQSSFG